MKFVELPKSGTSFRPSGPWGKLKNDKFTSTTDLNFAAFTQELDSTGTSGKETRHRLSRKDQLRVAMDWQHKLQLQVETLSWKYKSLEVEYNFLEKLIAEQREDLSKAKDWAKHAKETPTRVESLTYCL